MTDPIRAGIDIETTGLEWPEHRIIEVYVGLWQGGKLIEEMDQRIDPTRSIALDAQRVHKITLQDLQGKPRFADVVDDLVAILAKADEYVWHNGASFDGPFLDFEIKKAGRVMPQRPAVDTMVDGVWATFNGKKPNLQELCFACDVPYDPTKSHAAYYDVRVMMECFHRGLHWGFFNSQVQALSAAA